MVNSAMTQATGELCLDEAQPGSLGQLTPGPELDELEHRAWRAFLQKHAAPLQKPRRRQPDDG